MTFDPTVTIRIRTRASVIRPLINPKKTEPTLLFFLAMIFFFLSYLYSGNYISNLSNIHVFL